MGARPINEDVGSANGATEYRYCAAGGSPNDPVWMFIGEALLHAALSMHGREMAVHCELCREESCGENERTIHAADMTSSDESDVNEQV